MSPGCVIRSALGEGSSDSWIHMPLCVWSEKLIRGVAFVARCWGAATAAYLVASWVGLPHFVRAAISATIVSQERFEDTRTSLATRIIGTLIGIGVAIAVNMATAPVGLDLTEQIAAGVAICALVARCNPTLRVRMSTCPIVFLAAEPPVSTAMVGHYRGSGVVLGALIGAVLHNQRVTMHQNNRVGVMCEDGFRDHP